MTDLLLSIRKSPSNSDIPQFSGTPKQTSVTNFSHNAEVNTRNILGELKLPKFRNLVLTELGNGIKFIFQNEITEHLKNETSKSNQSVTNSYPKEIKKLKEQLNKKEALIKELIDIIRNLTTNSLKQQPVQSTTRQ